MQIDTPTPAMIFALANLMRWLERDGHPATLTGLSVAEIDALTEPTGPLRLAVSLWTVIRDSPATADRDKRLVELADLITQANEPEWLTVGEVAKRLGVPLTRVKNWVRKDRQTIPVDRSKPHKPRIRLADARRHLATWR